MRKVYQQIDQIAGNVITVQATGRRQPRARQVEAPGFSSLAQVIRAGGRQRLPAGLRGHARRRHRRRGAASSATRCASPFSDALLGRVFTGGGVPRDKGPVLDDNLIAIGGPSVNPAKRIIPRKMVRTGIPMIDVFNSLVESQKLPIFSRRGRALQRAARAHRPAGRGRHHHPRRHGPEVRRLPLLPRHARGGRRPLARDHVRPHRRRPGRRVPAGAGHRASPSPSSSRCRASACSCCSPT